MSERKVSMVRALVGLLGLALLACCLVRAIRHLGDLSNIQHITGVWMSLAAYLNGGVFYPPLESAGFYAGTRYMPLLFALIAAIARFVGGYLMAAKLAAMLSTLLLLGAVFAAVRHAKHRLIEAIALSALVLAFPEGLSALLSVHADALPVALTLIGLLVLDRDTVSIRHVIVAALLFALALSAKFSAVTGPAVAVVLLGTKGRWRLAAASAGLFVLLAGLETAAFQWASDGRFLTNFRSLGSGGMTWASIRIGPQRSGAALLQITPFLLVWPIALFLVFQRARASSLSVWDWYLLAALAVAVVVFTSPGTGFNHLLEFEAACVLVVAQTKNEPSEKGSPGARALVRPAFVGIVLLLGFWNLAGPADSSAIPPRVLAESLPSSHKLLCEDASVPVLLGERPIVMDPFAFRVLVEKGLVDDGPLARRIARQEFTALVMLRRIDEPDSLCPRFHFGKRVTDAMLRAYRFDRQVGGYFVFTPAPLP